jgi:ankyrin repeat protein
VTNKVLVDEEIGDGQTALYLAAKSGYTRIVKVLLEAGATVDKEVSGESAMHIAAEKGHLEIIKILIQFRASINKQTE